MPDEMGRGASVELSGVVKRYGDVDALRGISIRIEPGEFVTLLGPSGSGKTTTLNLIAGFSALTGGEVRIDGAPIEQVPPHKRNIGMIFQNYALFPHMTAFANVSYPLRQRKVRTSEVEERVQAALALVGLHGIGKRYPRQLSGGQQQRVAFARAIVFNPRVLLMDEPLGALDRRLRDSLQIEIKRIHRELGITFIYVTHDQEEALALSDRVAVFNDGVIEQIGAPSELYNRPQTRFVANFIGDSNVFEGSIEAQRGGHVLEWRGMVLAVPRPAEKRGGRGALILRPHQLHVTDDAASWDNALKARIVDVAFLGAAQKLELELEAGGRVVVRRPATAVRDAPIGARVTVGWNAKEGIVLLDAADEDEPEEKAAEAEVHGATTAASRGA